MTGDCGLADRGETSRSLVSSDAFLTRFTAVLMTGLGACPGGGGPEGPGTAAARGNFMTGPAFGTPFMTLASG